MQAVKAKTLSEEEEDASMKAETLELTLLCDYYGDMLTEKQQACFDLHYNQDLSLAEIAEELGISRQGVHDTLARTEAALRSMEQHLGCVSRARVLQRAYTELSAVAEELRSAGQADFAARILAAAELIKE